MRSFAKRALKILYIENLYIFEIFLSDMLVKEIMKTPFVVDKDISLKEAAKIMKDKKIGSLIFASDSKVKGIVTESDLTRDFGKQERISQIMNPKVITIDAEETVDIAVEMMKQNKIKRLPVLDRGKLVGIITSTEIIANFEEIEEEFIFE